MVEGEESSLELPSKATYGANNNSSLHKGRGPMGGVSPYTPEYSSQQPREGPWVWDKQVMFPGTKPHL